MDCSNISHCTVGSLARLVLLCCALTFSFTATPARSDDRENLLTLINQHRTTQSLGTLVSSKRLDSAAREHAHYLVEIGRLDHKGPNGETLVGRLQRAGYDYRRAGENLASGTPIASVVLDLWLESDGHRETLMEPSFVDAGIGRIGVGEGSYWVLVLGAPRR